MAKTQIKIRIQRGRYKDTPVDGREFTMLEGFQSNRNGGYVVVNGDAFGKQKIRIQLDGIRGYEVLNSGHDTEAEVIQFHKTEPTVPAQTPTPVFTDEEVMARIEERFEILDQMSGAAINGDIRALIVQGPPGVGKSYGVLAQMEKASMFDEIAGRKQRYEVVKGAITPIGLYHMLYKFSDPGCVLVFDDCDSIFCDELALNICKAALDSSNRRRIFWNADSHLLRREGVPDSFDFKGSVIFITNIQFENIRSKKLQDHLEALQSRCHFVDLGIDGQRGKLLRIKQIVSKGMLDEYCFGEEGNNDIIDFIHENVNGWREISLRLVIKLADLRKIMPDRWKQTARVTLMR